MSTLAMTMTSFAPWNPIQSKLFFLVVVIFQLLLLCVSVRVCVESGGMRSWRWQLFAMMRPCLRWCRLCPKRGCRPSKPQKKLHELWSYWKLLLKSLYFNSLTNADTYLDCVFEPVYWIVDNVTRWFGVVFVGLVIVLTSSVLVIVYLCLLPVILNTYPLPWIVWHLTYGHWLLIMVIFHYYKATTTSPGHPPQVNSDLPSVSMCKKCIIPKPARTHHCSICNTCILKMDHHCPWLNNCVGHFNQRYFFSFCVYMTMGCMYCSVSCKDMFLEAYNAVESYYQTPPPLFSFREKMFHKSVIFVWVLTSSVAIALGGLTLWHAILITRGETSVERHINKKEIRRLKEKGQVFRNPYHYGKINNWKVLFGVQETSHWLTRVVLPSSHAPHEDGLVWERSQALTRRDLTAI